MRELSRMFNVSNTTIKNRLKQNGIPLRDPNQEMSRFGKTRTLENNSFWKGGRVRRPDGYIYLNLGNKRVLEHRYVAEKKIGRKLKRGEVVHHINGIKDDNRPENLLVMSHSDHSTLHGLERESLNDYISKEDLKVMIDKGLSYKPISEHYGISYRSFYNLLERYELKKHYEGLMKNVK
ncbi:HNH endonuclease [Rossellomorea vietnamensis]